MTEPQGTVFGKQATEQIAKTVREVSRRMMNETPHRGRWQQRQPAGIILDAIASTCLGNGWYEMEIAEDTSEPDLSGASGVVDDCTPCSLADLDLTVGNPCEDVLPVDPGRPVPAGTGEFVYALDVEYLPLDIPSHCMIMPTRYSATLGQLYAVVRGPHPLVKVPKGDWDCCDGTVVQTECSWVLQEGELCAGWTRDCPS